MNGGNVLATITPSACPNGSAQYGIRSRINDGAWSSYTAWSTTLTASQVANDGVKYGYQSRVRCYVSDLSTSEILESSESIYIDPIPTPAVPVVAANTVGSTTTWSWPVVSCSGGTSIEYRYQYTISPSGYDSGWISNGSTNSRAFTTSTEEETYTLAVQARCNNAVTNSNWSASGSANYYRPFFNVPNPSAPVVSVVLNGGNALATITPSTCSSGTAEYGIRNRINDGIWSSYTAWSTTLTASQVANDGVKYGYQAQARCYQDATHISGTVTSTEATYIDPIPTPSVPTVTASTVGPTTTWSWTTPVCGTGSIQYQYNYTITPDGYASGWITIAASPVAFTTSTEDQTYAVAVQARCTNAITSSSWSASGSDSYNRPLTPTPAPSAPSIAVALNGANVQATITPVTCTLGTAQYGIRNRTNDGTWSGYTTWSTTLTASQTANDGVKYGYQAQARCYLDAIHISDTVTGAESTYIDPITAPAAPVVSANTAGSTTTWSWLAVSCAAGTTASYQYNYTISPSGYDSGWVSNGTNLSIAFTTSTEQQTYTVAVQARCSNVNAISNWSVSGSANYFRPISMNYRATGVYDSAGSTTAVVPAPSGLTNGDLIFVVLTRAAAVNPSGVPAGWTLVQSNLSTYGYWLYYKVASSEGASWTWTWAASAKTLGRSHAFYGAYNTSSPIQNSTTPYSDTANGKAIDIPTLTTSSNNTISFIFASAYSTSAKTFAVPTDWTEYDESGNTNPDFWQTVAVRSIPVSGTSTGIVSYPASSNSTYRVGVQILVNML